MLVLGIDPGAAKTGIAWINSMGQAKFSSIIADETIPFRYGSFRDQLADFLVDLEEDPTAIAIEKPKELPDRGENDEGVRSLIRVNCITAVAISEVTRLWPNTRLLVWQPRVWRRQFENKKDVAYRMSMKYGVDFDNDDESDAMGLADYAISRLMGGDRSAGMISL